MISTVFPRPFSVRTVVLARLVTAAAIAIVLRGGAAGKMLCQYSPIRHNNTQNKSHILNDKTKAQYAMRKKRETKQKQHVLIRVYLESCLRFFLLASSAPRLLMNKCNKRTTSHQPTISFKSSIQVQFKCLPPYTFRSISQQTTPTPLTSAGCDWDPSMLVRHESHRAASHCPPPRLLAPDRTSPCPTPRPNPVL